MTQQSEVTVKSVSKAVVVITSFSVNEPELSSSEIARKIGVSRAQAYRILTTLTRARILERNAENQKYSVGPVLYRQGNLYLNKGFLKVAEPVLRKLNDLTGESLNLSVFQDGNIIVIMKAVSRFTFRYDIDIGAMRPAYCSSMGKAFLSELTEAEFDYLYKDEILKPVTKYTIRTKTELKSQLSQIRKTGVAFTRQEGTEGIEGIASLIRNISGKAIAAMSIHLPIFRANDTTRARFATLIKMACGLVSYQLGYKESAAQDINYLASWWEENKPEKS